MPVSQTAKTTKATKTSKSTTKKTTKKTIEKVNKFTKKGQVKETPGERDPLRIFYTTLAKQKNSPMAIKWCIERGLLSDSEITQITMMAKMKKLKIV